MQGSTATECKTSLAASPQQLEMFNASTPPNNHLLTTSTRVGTSGHKHLNTSTRINTVVQRIGTTSNTVSVSSTSIRRLISVCRQQKNDSVLFSDFVDKVNRKFVHDQRICVITTRSVFLLGYKVINWLQLCKFAEKFENKSGIK
jgi:hypothetical protein